MTEPSDTTAVWLDRVIIVRSVPCRRCGYDLRGQPIGGPCPECGLPRWESVLSVVDPDARRLPRPRNPRGVGNGLFALVVTFVVVTVLLVARPLVVGLDALGVSWAGTLARFTPHWLLPLAGVALWLTLAAVAVIAPPPSAGSESGVRRLITLLRIGLIGGGAVLVGGWLLERRLLPAFTEGLPFRLLIVVVSLLILVAFRALLEEIGQRSREYRTARGGRQRIRDMMAAVVGIGVGEIVRWIGEGRELDRLQVSGSVVTGVSAFMLLVGLGYLLVNAWWIRRSLRRPPPTLRELITPLVDEPEEEGGPAAGGAAPPPPA